IMTDAPITASAQDMNVPDGGVGRECEVA
ncbi:MAG: hypothetical protein QOF01_117, partial [Thermomicrobiales bacterium]|nr:hypothetical protein [Thermomicrobiales bacterium]